jgi:hypothetical protein
LLVPFLEAPHWFEKYLISEEIKEIHQGTGICSVNLRILALGARYGGELLILNVEYLRKSSTGCLKAIRIKIRIIALRAFPFAFHHPSLAECDRFLMCQSRGPS